MNYSIAQQYTLSPGPRYIRQGPDSGEHFRITKFARVVKDAIQKKEKLTVDLDGTDGYGPSFLEEAFGGLIREEGVNLDELKRILYIKSEEEPKYKRWIENDFLPNAEKHKPLHPAN